MVGRQSPGFRRLQMRYAHLLARQQTGLGLHLSETTINEHLGARNEAGVILTPRTMQLLRSHRVRPGVPAAPKR